jgi:aminopeptidase C
MALTEEQIGKSMSYVARKMTLAGVDIQDTGIVVRWLIENPLPPEAEYQAQLTEWEEEEKVARIAALQEELNKLQGS